MIWLAEQGKKHIPWVEISEWVLKITIGHVIEHPMIKEHYITSIDILQLTNAWMLRKKEIVLSPEDKPMIDVDISDFAPWAYKVQIRCNLHWTFENEFII